MRWNLEILYFFLFPCFCSTHSLSFSLFLSLQFSIITSDPKIRIETSTPKFVYGPKEKCRPLSVLSKLQERGRCASERRGLYVGKTICYLDRVERGLGMHARSIRKRTPSGGGENTDSLFCSFLSLYKIFMSRSLEKKRNKFENAEKPCHLQIGKNLRKL